MQLFKTIWDGFYIVYETLFYGASVLNKVFFTDLSTFASDMSSGFLSSIIDIVLDIGITLNDGSVFTIGDMSLATFMIGLGIPFVVFYSLIKWFTDIVA